MRDAHPMQQHRAISDSSSTRLVPAVPGYDMMVRLRAARRWEGRRVADGRDVVLVCLPTCGWPVQSVQRVIDSTAALSRLHHRHLLAVYDVIPEAVDADGQPCVVVATAADAGTSLAQVLRSRGPLSLGELVTLLVPIGQALQEMHDQGQVHGWVSPEVIMFTADGMPLLAPRWIDERPDMSEQALRSGSVAPEVIEGFEATPESDGYAYAALAWQVVTGQAPGWVGSRADLEELAPQLPQPVSRALTQALAPDPATRTSLDDLLGHLHDLARPESIGMHCDDQGADVPGRIRAAARVAGSGHGGRSGSVARHRRPRSRRRIAMAAALVVATLAAGAAALTQGGAASEGARPALTAVSPIVDKPSESLTTDAANTDSKTDHEGKDRRALQIVQGLLDARAGAWTSGKVEDLTLAHAAGSPAMAADAGRLRAAQSTGARLSSVTFTAESGTVLPGSPAAASIDSAQGLARARPHGSDTFAMAVTVRREMVTADRDGRAVSSVQTTTDRVVFTVVKEAQGWRFVDWR
ncbi:hypothetical protein BH23ACT6_BH23ACT6_18290 [soil metagenome]